MASNSGEELVDPVGSTTEDMPPDVRRSAAFGPAGTLCFFHPKIYTFAPY